MTTLTLKINERTKAGKAFLEMAKVMIKESKSIEIVSNTFTRSLAEEKYLNSLKKASLEMKELSSGRKNGKTLNDFFDAI